MRPSAVFCVSLIIFGMIIITIINWKITAAVLYAVVCLLALVALGFLIEKITDWLNRADRDFENRNQ